MRKKSSSPTGYSSSKVEFILLKAWFFFLLNLLFGLSLGDCVTDGQGDAIRDNLFQVALANSYPNPTASRTGSHLTQLTKNLGELEFLAEIIKLACTYV